MHQSMPSMSPAKRRPQLHCSTHGLLTSRLVRLEMDDGKPLIGLSLMNSVRSVPPRLAVKSTDLIRFLAMARCIRYLTARRKKKMTDRKIIYGKQNTTTSTIIATTKKEMTLSKKGNKQKIYRNKQ